MIAKSCLVVAAHPDDEVLGCGGTIARLAHHGSAVHIALLADGVTSRGETRVPLAYSQTLVARQQCAQAAAAILGAAPVTFGHFPDNRMDSVDLLDVVRFVETLVERHRPDLVLTHHPGDLNIDHRVVQQAVVTACRPQPGHPVETVLFFEVASSTEWQPPAAGSIFAPNWFVDISAHLETRRRALKEYGMEMRPWPHGRSYEAVDHLARWRGASAGVEAAEAFELGRAIRRM